ncbi:MAG: glutathione S-transferase [Psychromonas sp.]|jgi:glutathione S-transferase|uniref:glutathione S-transferase n=1 Tax=Psychromonas sp. TaxID=1884585 RepID=UPI0039E368DB
MYHLELTYFDFHGGRAEPARLAMHIGGVEFDDIRFPFSEFAEIKKTTPLNQVPTLKIDGLLVTQSNSINRFVAKLAGLYPANDLQALLCDEIMDALEDITHKIVATFRLEGEALRSARQALADGPLSEYLQWVQAKLEQQGGQYFIENRLTIADLKVFVWTRSLLSGHLDHIPRTLVENVAPKLHLHMQRIAQIPAIADYYAAAT